MYYMIDFRYVLCILFIQVSLIRYFFDMDIHYIQFHIPIWKIDAALTDIEKINTQDKRSQNLPVQSQVPNEKLWVVVLMKRFLKGYTKYEKGQNEKVGKLMVASSC